MEGFGATKGRDEGTQVATSNPRADTAKALADGVMTALRSGDLVAARAAAKALEAFVDALSNLKPQPVPDIRFERRNRDGNTG